MIRAVLGFAIGAAAAIVALYATGAIAFGDSMLLLVAIAVGLLFAIAHCAVDMRDDSAPAAREATIVSPLVRSPSAEMLTTCLDQGFSGVLESSESGGGSGSQLLVLAFRVRCRQALGGCLQGKRKYASGFGTYLRNLDSCGRKRKQHRLIGAQQCGRYRLPVHPPQLILRRAMHFLMLVAGAAPQEASLSDRTFRIVYPKHRRDEPSQSLPPRLEQAVITRHPNLRLGCIPRSCAADGRRLARRISGQPATNPCTDNRANDGRAQAGQGDDVRRRQAHGRSVPQPPGGVVA